MKFMNPEIEVVKFNVVDVITASGCETDFGELGPNDLPIG